MTDQINEQISQFIDDEMSLEESEFFLRRLQRDESARSQYLRYQLIGAAVRGEYANPHAADLGRRLERALDETEAAPRWSAVHWRQFASGAGIAAGVAVVAVFGLRSLNFESDAIVAGTVAGGASQQLDLPSYVVPTSTVDSQEFVRIPAEVTGIQFLMHHAGYTSGVSRTIMQSSMIAAQELDPTEESEAEDESIIEPINGANE